MKNKKIKVYIISALLVIVIGIFFYKVIDIKNIEVQNLKINKIESGESILLENKQNQKNYVSIESPNSNGEESRNNIKIFIRNNKASSGNNVIFTEGSNNEYKIDEINISDKKIDKKIAETKLQDNENYSLELKTYGISFVNKKISNIKIHDNEKEIFYKVSIIN